MTVVPFTRLPGQQVTPVTQLDSVLVRGSRLNTQLSAAVTAADLSWSVSEVTQLQLTVEDPGYKIWGQAKFSVGTAVTYIDPADSKGERALRLRITAVDLGGGSSGRGGLTVNARSEGVYYLKRRRGPLVMSGVSPSRFVELECRAVGLRAVVQPSATRAQVARDVPAGGAGSGGGQTSSSWTTFQRLATELGFYVFEYQGTVYFGKPSWLMEQGKASRLRVSFGVHVKAWGAEDAFAALTAPTIAQSEDAEVPVTVSGIQLHRGRFREVRPGGVLELAMVAPFNTTYLVKSLSFPLMGTGPMTVDAETPKNPDPQPPQPTEGTAQAGSAGSPTTDMVRAEDGSMVPAGFYASSKSALEFVRVAMTQQGKRYVYGAEASPKTNSPGGFDCSELVQWALARVGVTFVDGSANQIARCKAISVSQALRTRGALVYKPGHIGISLGDGKRTMEARNASKGVGVFPAADISWTRGGLVPGLRYS